ncbi:Transcription factor TFIIIB component B [Coelomomyces lativittatus]|nr:Transcription factor TFIIIB component B [Coelomomyces lativittatus]KAJ1517172.1 Transcription factor TFIIIB component B [Coelomomyces lativittatus]KAJ1518072.1 Transcription factor TFIIIB component B [Coelomomyces lativittatus]
MTFTTSAMLTKKKRGRKPKEKVITRDDPSASLSSSTKITPVTPIDLNNEQVRMTLPLKYFCNDSKFQSTQDPMVSQRMQSILDIRKKRKQRSLLRTHLLKNATSVQDAHRIRRTFEMEEEKHREAEQLILNGFTVLPSSQSHTSLSSLEMTKIKHTTDSFDIGKTPVTEENKNENENENEKDHGNSHPNTPFVYGPQVKVVDGQIIIDTKQTYVCPQPKSQPRTARLDQPILEETLHYYNQSHFLNLQNRKSPRWRPDELDLLYQGLAAWGLNFEAIARMIPGKTRSNVRNKYKSECVHAKAKVEHALANRKKMEIHEYAEATGISIDDFLSSKVQEVS